MKKQGYRRHGQARVTRDMASSLMIQVNYVIPSPEWADIADPIIKHSLRIG
jgi:hypothetical protein